MVTKKTLTEMNNYEEPTTEELQRKTLDEIKEIEKQEAIEDEKADENNLEEGVTEMTPEEIKQFTKKTTPSKTSPVKTPPTKNNPTKNLITKEKTLLYNKPTNEEWATIHNIKPQKLLFYYPITKEEYKEYFLLQVKYKTKIIASTGGKLIR